MLMLASYQHHRQSERRTNFLLYIQRRDVCIELDPNKSGMKFHKHLKFGTLVAKNISIWMLDSLVIISESFPHSLPIRSHKSGQAVATISQTCGVDTQHMFIFTSSLITVIINHLIE